MDIELVKQFTKKHLKGEKTGHDYYHGQRVANLATKMYLSDYPDAHEDSRIVAIIQTGSYLHDTIDEKICNHCGRCIGKCPFGAVEASANGYRIYIGGRWGKKVAQGNYLDKVFTEKEEVLSIVEKAILLFREQGITGERFADTVARIGFENVEKQLMADDLLTRKQENIAAQKHMKGGATC